MRRPSCAHVGASFLQCPHLGRISMHRDEQVERLPRCEKLDEGGTLFEKVVKGLYVE